ncbi:MAG: protein kinase [Anaerolineae bacterium]|jgi:hypothetical protein
MVLRAGQVLRDRYRIDALLGQGGMGAVYRATDMAFHAPVALKENWIVSPESQRQFRREAGLLYRLRHPNLPRVIDHFHISDQGQYLVMDYVEGEDLKQIIARRGPASEAEALSWIGQVLDALAYLHAQQIIHRDVKPANVKITPEGAVFLVDFGLAKVHDASQETTIGARGVTPGYAPPEQYGAGRTDARTDVYSTGATLYALLAGAPPPDALDLVVGRAALLSLAACRPEISPGVAEVVQQAMQTRPADRYASAADFRQALAEAAPGALGEKPAGIEAPTRFARARQKPAPPPPPAPVGREIEAPLPTPEPTQIAAEGDAARPAPGAPRAQPSKPPPAAGPAGQRGRVWQALASRPQRWLLAAIAVVLVGVIVAAVALSTRLPGGEEQAAVPAPVPIQGELLFTRSLAGPPEIYRLRGEEMEQVTNTPGDAGSWGAVLTEHGIYFTSDRSGKREIYRLHSGTTDQMTHTPGPAESWGPAGGGTGILFTSDRDGKPEVYRMHGGMTERVTQTPGGAGSWGPVSTEQGIYFTSDRDGEAEIYRLHEGQTDRMTHTPGPGGSWGVAFGETGILFTSDRDGKPEVYRMHGGTTERVTNTPGNAASWGPVWTEQGIYFASERDGKPEVYHLHDGQTRRVTHTPDPGASWLDPGY